MAIFEEPQQTIVIRRGKKKGHAAHHGGAWKVAYADFVTAMMAFFMLLWLLANADKSRLKGLAEYFSPATVDGAPMEPSFTSLPGDQQGAGGHRRRAQADSTEPKGEPSSESGTKGTARGGTANIPEAALRLLADELTIALEKPNDPDGKKQLKIEEVQDGLRVNLMDTANRTMFKGTTAQLNDYARDMLTSVARKLVKSGGRIAIEGHTDSTGGDSDANWHLSGDRALAARTVMVAAGLTPDHFSEVVAKAGTQPIYPDRPDRPENRRITIVIQGDPSALPSDVSFKF